MSYALEQPCDRCSKPGLGSVTEVGQQTGKIKNVSDYLEVTHWVLFVLWLLLFWVEWFNLQLNFFKKLDLVC